MKYIFLPIFTIVAVANAMAQGDLGGKSFNIAPLKKEEKVEVKTVPKRFQSVDFPSISPPSSSFNTPKTTTVTRPIGEVTSKVNMTSNSDFKNPNLAFEKKLNQKEGEGVVTNFRRNEFLGDFKTKSTFVKIRCRDYGAIDGDRVKIYINEVLAISNIYLEYEFKAVEITLKNGINTIDFVALNEGDLMPNTAQFDVYDDKGQIICANAWNLSEGFKATIIIVKE